MKCSVTDCEKKASRKGMCYMHEKRQRRHGDVNAVAFDIPARGTIKLWLEDALSLDVDYCIEWPFRTCRRSGYGSFLLNGKSKPTHRYVCEVTHGPAPSKSHHAAHSCGNSSCVNKRHISWKTPKENNADKILHGTSPSGENNGNAKLTETDVIAIRQSEESNVALAEKYGVKYATIWAVRKGLLWRSLESSARAAAR